MSMCDKQYDKQYDDRELRSAKAQREQQVSERMAGGLGVTNMASEAGYGSPTPGTARPSLQHRIAMAISRAAEQTQHTAQQHEDYRKLQGLIERHPEVAELLSLMLKYPQFL